MKGRPGLGLLARPPDKPADWDPKRPGLFIVPVPNIQLDVKRITLDNRTLVATLSKLDKASFEARRRLSYSMPLLGSRYYTDAMAVKLHAPGADFEKAAAGASHQLERLITTCRLLNYGSPYFETGLVRQRGVRGSARDFYPAFGHDVTGLAAQYMKFRIRRAEVRPLKRVYSALPDTDDRTTRAINRFNAAHGRESQEDTLIDLWIALEALFSPSDGELTHRIAMRAAYFLGSSPDERSETYKKLVESYKLRNVVVHGRRSTGATQHEVIRLTQDYLRKALRRIILSSEPFDADRLDDVVARGGC